MKNKRFVVNIDESSLENNNTTPNTAVEKRGVYFASNTPNKPSKTQGEPKTHTPKRHGKGGAKIAAKTLFVSIFLVLLGAGIAFWGIVCINDVFAFDRINNPTPVIITIPENSTTNSIIDILAEKKMIRQRWFSKLFYKVFHTNRDKDKNIIVPKYLSGVYYLDSARGLEGFLNAFKSMPSTAKTVKVVFPEGFTTFQMFKRLEDMGVARQDHLFNALQNADFEFSFIDNLPRDVNQRMFLLEGYLFPAQYEFYEGEDPNSVIRRMLAAFSQRWTKAYQTRADKLGMTMDEVITLASIIQKEAADTGQMAGVSYVFHNRLNNIASWPSLGSDATRDYITTFARGRIPAGNIFDTYSAAYNTVGNSAIRGLPPGPVSNPGKDAIEAALNPESPDGKSYFYFMHNKKGEIFYAATQREFDQLVAQIRYDDQRS
ncbi:MAG: endolytic transglycosylase MltG [Oscillospiraceae bacterium]|nr:endolytic transglycosylase MltG [Oscillospiraceae bacterium]